MIILNLIRVLHYAKIITGAVSFSPLTLCISAVVSLREDHGKTKNCLRHYWLLAGLLA